MRSKFPINKKILVDKNFKAEHVYAPAFNFFTNDVRNNTTSSFYKPYRNDAKDIIKTVAAPIYAPLVWGALSVVTALATVASAFVSLGYLAMAGVSRAQGHAELTSERLSCAKQFAILSGVSALVTPVLAIMAAVSIPENLVKIASRGVQTAIVAVNEKKEEAAYGETDYFDKGFNPF
ncbi:Uncharacterised protein [Legionella beliardensis]|uniref:Transmembrane protein n=1 Tax=Legionella beliardensis TaxID=91822 RepID=A0A378I422_9GAMM|nr:hypothetical protein [Legionella beliardensis]STX29929.1 Uncharacterised protein [Legionella beliardensis]